MSLDWRIQRRWRWKQHTFEESSKEKWKKWWVPFVQYHIPFYPLSNTVGIYSTLCTHILFLPKFTVKGGSQQKSQKERKKQEWSSKWFTLSLHNHFRISGNLKKEIYIYYYINVFPFSTCIMNICIKIGTKWKLSHWWACVCVCVRRIHLCACECVCVRSCIQKIGQQ